MSRSVVNLSSLHSPHDLAVEWEHVTCAGGT